MIKYWKWLIVLVIAATVLIRFKLASTPVAVSVVQKTNIVAEVMGTGTPEARVKTTLSAAGQLRIWRTPRKSIPAGEGATRQMLWEWLSLADGRLPGEFLRMHDLNPAELVAQGLLSLAPGRWSDGYLAGPQVISVR